MADLIILGAGLAGLICAQDLTRSGGRAMAMVEGRIRNVEGKVLVRGTCIYQIPRPK